MGTNERKCRVCGCTDSDCRQCTQAQGFPCHWARANLCSRCKNEIDQDKFGFTAKQAKRLSHRKDQLYKRIEDRSGDEWLVDSVIDNGRMMFLYKAETDGKVKKAIHARHYKDYKIILSEEDFF